MDTRLQPKLIYLARRHPSLDAAGFTARWRRHGALGMSLPRWRNIARYVHCDVVRCFGSTHYDAVGLVWHRSPQARLAHLADTGSRAQMEADERETFAEPIADTCLVAREMQLERPRNPGDATGRKLIRFLGLDTASDAEAAHERLLAELSSTRERAEAIGAVPSGHVINVALPPERGNRWGLDADAVEELWFADVATALRAAESLPTPPGVRETRVITNEIELYAA